MPLRYRVWKRILNGTPRARYYGPDKTPRVEWNEYRSRESYGDTGRGSTALQGGTHSENGRAQDERSASGTISVEESEKEAEDECEDLIKETGVEEDCDVPTVTQSGQSKLVEAVGYFATYAKDPHKFAVELRALVQHFGLARKISVELL